jgi:molybdate transport system substrate-binding protein
MVLACCAGLAIGCSIGSCGGDSTDSSGARSDARPVAEVVIYAAASTRDALLALEAECEAEHEVDLVFNFGGSGALANQIVAGGKADIFLSADEVEMDKLAASGVVDDAARRPLLSNRLVVIEPADGPSRFSAPFDADQLASDGVRLLSLGDPALVPVGRHARSWLESRGAWAAVASRVLPALDARAALAAVESGGAQAGIVFRTDASRSRSVRVVHLVPREEAPRIVYPLAVLRGRANDAVSSCAAFLASERGLAVFAAHGFEPASRGAASSK